MALMHATEPSHTKPANIDSATQRLIERTVNTHSSPPMPEKIAVLSLSSLYAMRMLGLFMILPVIMVDGQTLLHATPALLGTAMGVYGLTQAILQIPAGMLSDRIGRKPVILAGLVLFALGSVIAANADSVYGVIIGRALQGCGAIASAIMALLTDLTAEHNRMKAMASVGSSIGLAFALALVVGPWLSDIGGLSLIFTLTAGFAVLGIAITLWVVPTPPAKHHRDASPVLSELFTQLKNIHLWPLNLGIFILHMSMVALFVAIPPRLQEAGLPLVEHSWVYLGVLFASFACMIPMIIIAEKYQRMKSVVICGSLLMALALMLMLGANALWSWVALLWLYFWGFNLMEASLPSWLSKAAPAGSKGSAMGIYSSFQFLGAFLGGSAGAWIVTEFGLQVLFVVLGALMLIWAAILSMAKAPTPLSSVRLHCTSISPELLRQLTAQQGVHEIRTIDDEHAIYLKVDHTFELEPAQALLNETR